jgi:autotransporter-associated beta strand protein
MDNIPSSIDRTHFWTFYTAPNAAPVATFSFDQNHLPPHALTLRYVAASINLLIKTLRVNVTSKPGPGHLRPHQREATPTPPAGADVSPATLTLSARKLPSPSAAAVATPPAPSRSSPRATSPSKAPPRSSAPPSFSGDLALAPSAAGTTQYLGGAVSGSGALVKSGPGTAILLAANAYPDGTTVSGGTLNSGAPTSLGTGPVNVMPGAAVGLADVLLYSVPMSNVFTIAGAARRPRALRNDTMALQSTPSSPSLSRTTPPSAEGPPTRLPSRSDRSAARTSSKAGSTSATATSTSAATPSPKRATPPSFSLRTKSSA